MKKKEEVEEISKKKRGRKSYVSIRKKNERNDDND
jgi:hypothetical protein